MGEKIIAPEDLTRRKLLGGICALSLAAGSGLMTMSQAHAAAAGESYILKAGGDLIAAAKRGSTAAFRALLKSYIDVTSIAMFALGKYRRKLPASQKSEYISLVEAFMVNTLTQFGRKFKGHKFQFVNAKKTSRGLSVQSKLKFLGGKKQNVSWKLVGKGGSYRVADINFQGVWLASLLRSTFTGHIKKNGNDVNALMVYLRKAAGPGGATVKSDFNG